MRINVFVLLWHPLTENSVTAGGIRRIIEFSKRIPVDMNFHILDNSPTIFDFQLPQCNVYQYRIPKIVYRILKFNFILGRLLEWVITSIKLFFIGKRILKQKKCDVIYLPISELLFIFLPAILLKLRYDTKIVCDILNFEMPYGGTGTFFRQMRSKGYSLVRSLLLPLYIRFQFAFIRLFLGKIDCIMSVSQYLANYIKKKGATCFVGFTPSGIDFNFIDGTLPAEQPFDAIFVGRHEPEKGVFDLLEVWKHVLALRPNSRLIMVGPCNSRTRQQIDRKLNEYELTDYVSIKGTLSEEEKIKFIKASKVFIHLGHIEPLVPVITVLEGLACGLPAVLYDQASYKEHPEIYEHPSFALVPWGDFQTAASKIVMFLNMNGSHRQNVAQHAKQYSQSYDWSKICQIEFDAIRQIFQHN